MDFMKKNSAKIDFEKGNMSIPVISRGPKLLRASTSRQAALTVFSRRKVGHSTIPANRRREKRQEH
jgi:hypothetical protein